MPSVSLSFSSYCTILFFSVVLSLWLRFPLFFFLATFYYFPRVNFLENAFFFWSKLLFYFFFYSFSFNYFSCEFIVYWKLCHSFKVLVFFVQNFKLCFRCLFSPLYCLISFSSSFANLSKFWIPFIVLLSNAETWFLLKLSIVLELEVRIFKMIDLSIYNIFAEIDLQNFFFVFKLPVATCFHF